MRKDSSDIQRGRGPRAGDIVLRLGILPPDGDPEDFKVTPNILASEYATRYLEQIGVKPSKQALDLVHKSIPLTSDQIKTTLRAKGHVNDEVTISCPRVEHLVKLAPPISAFSFAQLTLCSGDAPSSSSLPDIGGKKTSSIVEDRAPEPCPEPCPEPGSTFRDLASLYLYPFNIKSSGPVDTSHPLVKIGKKEESESTPSKSSFWAPESDKGLIEGVTAEHEVAEELVQELIVTPEVILMILTPLEAALVEWYKAQSQETVARLPYTDFKEGVNLISSDASIKFYATMINMLHTEFIKGSKLYCADAESRMMRQSLMRREMSKGSMESRAGSKRGMGMSGKSGRMGANMRLGGGGGGGGGGALGESTPASASTSISRPMALQQYDLGYKIFVKERMLAIAESEDAQRDLLDREMNKRTSGAGVMPIARVSESAGNDGSQPGSRRSSLGGRAASPEAGAKKSPSTIAGASSTFSPCRSGLVAALGSQRKGGQGASFNATASMAHQAGCSFGGQGSLIRAGSGEGINTHNSGVASSSTLRRDSAQKDERLSSIGGILKPNINRPHVPRVPGLAGEPLLTDAHPLVQKSIANLTSAHALTAASMARAILESLDAKDFEYLQQVRLFTLQKEFATIYSDQRKTRAGLFFSLPIFLMFLRLSIQSLFSTMYPLWSRTKDGRDSMLAMDKLCCELLDPHSYLQKNLTVLQSSPAAIDLIAKNPSKGHGPERDHFTDTSSLLRSALLSPSSAETRKMMVAQSQKAALKQGAGTIHSESKTKTQLTFAQRELLFSEARRHIKR